MAESIVKGNSTITPANTAHISWRLPPAHIPAAKPSASCPVPGSGRNSRGTGTRAPQSPGLAPLSAVRHVKRAECRTLIRKDGLVAPAAGSRRMMSSGHSPLTAAAAAGVPAGGAVGGSQGGGMAARLWSQAAAGGSGDLLPPPPFAALAGSEIGSFAQATITSRLPAILESMLRDLEAELREAGLLEGGTADDQVAAGLQELHALRQSMLDDSPLKPLAVPGAPEQTQVLLDSANACLQLMAARLRQGLQDGTAAPTWLRLPWLTVECYMYAAVHAALQPPLAGRDPFHRQKAAAWAKSAAAAAEMAEEVELLFRTLASAAPPASATSDAAGADAGGQAAVAAAGAAPPARAATLAGMQMALWGNKADLSLLVNASGLDGLSLSVSGASTSAAASTTTSTAPARVIVDHSEAVWAVVSGLRARRASEAAEAGQGQGQGQIQGRAAEPVRVDIILDNSGLELFADLCLADLLMEAGVADRVILHGKPISWFVSDTLARDLEALLSSCEAELPPSDQVPAAAWQPVRRLAARWRGHLAAGRWRWEAHPFWCTPAPFCWMAAVAPDLYEGLAGSGLLVFKGDLNYRKLAHDCRWPHTTPFETALQGFRPAPLVVLRTLKADVVAGLAPGQSEQLTAADADWLVNGKWGMVQAAV